VRGLGGQLCGDGNPSPVGGFHGQQLAAPLLPHIHVVGVGFIGDRRDGVN
jgi:hypothetical protein